MLSGEARRASSPAGRVSGRVALRCRLAWRRTPWRAQDLGAADLRSRRPWPPRCGTGRSAGDGAPSRRCLAPGPQRSVPVVDARGQLARRSRQRYLQAAQLLERIEHASRCPAFESGAGKFSFMVILMAASPPGWARCRSAIMRPAAPDRGPIALGYADRRYPMHKRPTPPSKGADHDQCLHSSAPRTQRIEADSTPIHPARSPGPAACGAWGTSTRESGPPSPPGEPDGPPWCSWRHRERAWVPAASGLHRRGSPRCWSGWPDAVKAGFGLGDDQEVRSVRARRRAGACTSWATTSAARVIGNRSASKTRGGAAVERRRQSRRPRPQLVPPLSDRATVAALCGQRRLAARCICYRAAPQPGRLRARARPLRTPSAGSCRGSVAKSQPAAWPVSGCSQ